MANRRIDEATGVETVGHEWDGIEELNNPLPRWWVWTFYACIVFAIGYCIAYPAWPLISKGTEGVLGWTSRGQLATEIEKADEAKAALLASLDKASIEQIASDPELLRSAVAGGNAAFKVNCVQCHGSGAAGSRGYPNLADDDWLWGGSLPEIQQTILNGIRHPGDDRTRVSEMSAFGRDGLLSAAEIRDVTGYVLSLSGQEQPSASTQRGAEIFAANCVTCHGADAKGLRQFGAPDLTDAIWLYGGTRADIESQVNAPQHGVMPAWSERLDPVTIKMLAAYVHSLGGGEDFVEVAENPAVEVDEQPATN
ncbi:MAG: cytochrome-c oxidase, cbb3-type subunit III [Novosphingobium sp.]|nr:cytochrome-c oxidase, cbb3-type subunit III [Novosphingobium sp.]